LLSLGENPDKEEIQKDLEAAIGEKCLRFLKPHKNVITKGEIDQIILEMGPVETGNTEGEPHQKKTESANTTPKRLYNIKEGAVIAGVANGVAAYFNLDVVLVRVIFVILAVLTSGGFTLVYVLMIVFVPYAHTDKDRARAYGLPFTAQELIDNAKKSYEGFRANHHFKHEWKKEREEWKKMMREERRAKHREYRHRTSWLSETIWSIFGVAAWTLIISFGLWYGYHHNANIHDFLNAVNSKAIELHIEQ